MHHPTELSFVDEFRWVSPLHYLKNGWQKAAVLWCMLQAEKPSLHYYCAVVLHSCIILPPVGLSSKHQYHCCQLTRKSSCVSNFYRTFKVFIWLSLVRRMERDIINLHKFSCKVSIILIRCLWNLNFLTHLTNILKYKISLKSVQWDPSCFMPAGEQINTKKQIVVLLKFWTGLKTIKNVVFP